MNLNREYAIPLPQSACPTCGHVTTNASPGNIVDIGKPPKPGDVGLCAKCGELLELDQDLKLTYATLDNVLKLSPSFKEQITKHQEQIRRERPLG